MTFIRPVLYFVFAFCSFMNPAYTSTDNTLLQLLPLAMKMLPQQQAIAQDHEALIASIVGGEKVKEAPPPEKECIVTIHPNDVILSDDLETQDTLIQNALESAIALHLEEVRPTRRNSFRILADRLIAYAEQWSLPLQVTSEERYWKIMQRAISKSLIARYKTEALYIQNYVKNKIHLKLAFGL